MTRGILLGLLLAYLLRRYVEPWWRYQGAAPIPVELRSRSY